MIQDTNNLHNIEGIDIPSLKRSFNLLSKKVHLDESNELSKEDISNISNYKNQRELWSLYEISQNKYLSFKDMILDF